MSVTNAISSVIIVGAIIAALAGSENEVFNTSKYFWSCGNHFSRNKHFWWISSNSKNVGLYKIKKKKSK